MAWLLYVFDIVINNDIIDILEASRQEKNGGSTDLVSKIRQGLCGKGCWNLFHIES
jgi:hypothetical protein